MFSFYFDDRLRAYPPPRKSFPQTLQMPVQRLNLLQEVQAAGIQPFAASRSRGHQPHWSALEPLLGISSVHLRDSVDSLSWMTSSRLLESLNPLTPNAALHQFILRLFTFSAHFSCLSAAQNAARYI